MLEQRVLLVRPPDEAGLRAIVAAETGLALGYAWWRPRRGAWWRPPVLAVHEQEDEPLLFTVRRWCPLLPWREVRDAEGGRVGYVRGACLIDRLGRCLARREALGQNGAYGFRQRDGRNLGELAQSAEGVRLAFGAAVEHEPFVKMLLLGAALIGAPG